MKRLWLAMITLPLSVLVIATAWLLLTPGGLNWVYLQLRDQPGLRLDIERLDGSFASAIDVSGLLLISDGVELELQQARLEFELWPLLLGDLRVRRLELSEGEVELPPGEGGEPPQPDAIRIELPLRRIAVELLHVDGLDIVQGDGRHTIERLQGRIGFDRGRLELASFELVMPGVRLSARGHAESAPAIPFELSAEWQLSVPDLPLLQGGGRVHGDLKQIHLEQTLRAPSSVRVSADIEAPLAGPRWRARVQVQEFDSRRWSIDGPAFKATTRFQASGTLNQVAAVGSLSGEHPVSGPLDVEFDLAWGDRQRLDIQSLMVKSSQSDSQASASGWWRPGNAGGEVELMLEWQALRWPLQAEQPVFSPYGQGRVSGTVDDYRFEVESSSPLAELPEARLRARGEGKATGLEFSLLEITADKARIDSTGRVSWQDELSWQATSEAHDIDPARLLADWPGRLSLRADHSGSLVDGAWRARARIERLAGELRGFPVTLSGDAAWQDGRLTVHEGVFRSGDSRVEVSGEVNQRMELDWRIASSRLDELYPRLTGSLHADGRLSGSLEQPHLKAAARARDLAYGDYSVRMLEADVELDLHDPTGVQGTVSADGLELAGQSVSRVEVIGDSSQARLSLLAADARLELALSGRLENDGWRGQLRRADLASGKFGDWKLTEPAALTLGPDWRPALSSSCWTSDSGRLCAAVERVDGGQRAALELGGFVLQRLQPWLPPGLQVDGAMGAGATLDFVDGRVSGSASLKLSPGRIAYPFEGGEIESLDHQGAEASVELDRQGVRGQARLVIDDRDRVVASLQLPGANVMDLDADRQPMRGRVEASIERLSMLGELIPEVQRLQGRLTGGIDLSGMLAQPRLSGELNLRDGRLEIPRLGLKVTDIALQANGDDTGGVEYRMQAISGEGQLTVEGRARHDADEGWSTRLSIVGKDLEVSRIPEAQVLASPSITLSVKPYRVDVEGRVEIPYAHIEPREFTTTARVSQDVVIVGEERPREQPWKIHSKVQIVFGERVHFSGFGLEGRLRGQLQLEDTPGLPTRASGEISIIDGRYRAYGQRLVIEQGSLLFSGGPLTSPGIDARAVRRVGAVTAGVRARGQAQQPVIELFSIPAMGQTEILSYLLLGRPLDSASDADGAMMAQAAVALGLSGGDRLARSLRDRFGLDEMRVESSDSGDQASLVLGRYLSPRLYVSYGIGLVEAFNTLVVRYDISDKWQLKAESGEAHGADLIYTIER